MIHASANAESIVAPTLFRPAFSHSLAQRQPSAQRGGREIGRTLNESQLALVTPTGFEPVLPP